MARKTIQSEFYLIKQICRGDKLRLEKLEHLGISMNSIVEIDKRGQSIVVDDYEFMDNILDEMHAVCNVDMEVKCQFITRFCISYGLCCITAGSFKKAIEINEKAIFLIKFAFGKNCVRNKYLSRCYQNIGVSYQKLGNTEEAKNAYTKADNFKTQYTAWNDRNMLTIPARELKRVTPPGSMSSDT